MARLNSKKIVSIEEKMFRTPVECSKCGIKTRAWCTWIDSSKLSDHFGAEVARMRGITDTWKEWRLDMEGSSKFYFLCKECFNEVKKMMTEPKTQLQKTVQNIIASTA